MSLYKETDHKVPISSTHLRMPSLNKKQLTKKEVKSLIESEGCEPDLELTAVFREERGDYINAPKVYSLPGDQYLYVSDENNVSLPGKGNLLTREDMLKSAEWHEDMKTRYARGGGNSVEDWRYHSKLKNRLPENTEALIRELSEISGIELDRMDRSYKSLDLISQYLIEIGYKPARQTLYDHLVAYVGEVLRVRSDGLWHSKADDNLGYPCILGPKGEPAMMPVNAVGQALDAYGGCKLKQPTINEYRNYCAVN